TTPAGASDSSHSRTKLDVFCSCWASSGDNPETRASEAIACFRWPGAQIPQCRAACETISSPGIGMTVPPRRRVRLIIITAVLPHAAQQPCRALFAMISGLMQRHALPSWVNFSSFEVIDGCLHKTSSAQEDLVTLPHCHG